MCDRRQTLSDAASADTSRRSRLKASTTRATNALRCTKLWGKLLCEDPDLLEIHVTAGHRNDPRAQAVELQPSCWCDVGSGTGDTAQTWRRGPITG
jgi:hypothetical protein